MLKLIYFAFLLRLQVVFHLRLLHDMGFERAIGVLPGQVLQFVLVFIKRGLGTHLQVHLYLVFACPDGRRRVNVILLVWTFNVKLISVKFTIQKLLSYWTLQNGLEVLIERAILEPLSLVAWRMLLVQLLNWGLNSTVFELYIWR